MNNEDLIGAMETLASAIREQNEVQQEISASNRALTDMLGFTVTAINELNAKLHPPASEAKVTDASLQMIG